MSKEIGPIKGASPIAPAVVVVMGVSGCGKSTVGALLARHFRWEFEDADSLHPTSNVDKMHSGVRLTDEDRGYLTEEASERLGHDVTHRCACQDTRS